MKAEEVSQISTRSPSTRIRQVSRPQRLAEISMDGLERFALPLNEFARVLGGGVMPGSVVLIGGDPGIGKSTLMLQAAIALSRDRNVLYVSGEESEAQIRSRAERLVEEEELVEGLYFMTDTNLEWILGQVENLKPEVLVIDSIQTVSLPHLDSSAGSILQVRESASHLQSVAKDTGVAVFLVGHVTKEGAIAGPRVLEHLVDTVLYLEGDPYQSYRILRSVKNRFGPTTEVGVFEMGSSGMVEVPNPSEAFLSERVIDEPGSAIAVTMEGSRPLLVEVQGLTSATAFGHPRRTANGIDLNRLLLTLAVLNRRVGLKVADQDVFVNVVGGLKVSEPAADLAIAVAIASSVRDRPLPADTAFVGEIGLSGELRAISQLPIRIREAARMGFKRVIAPESRKSDQAKHEGLELLTARSLRQVLKIIF